MSGFDDICDRSAPGKLVPDDAVWDAVREVAGGKVAHVDYVHQGKRIVYDLAYRAVDAATQSLTALPADMFAADGSLLTIEQLDASRGYLGRKSGLPRCFNCDTTAYLEGWHRADMEESANTRLPDGRLLDDVLAENERLTRRACVFKQALRAVAEGTVTREMMQYNVIKAEELAALGWECDPCTDGWHPNGWVLDMSTMRYRPPVDAELLTIACERANLAERVAALEAEIARWRNAMRSGCMTPAEADKHTLNPAGHLIWWPDAAPVPYFSGQPGPK